MQTQKDVLIWGEVIAQTREEDTVKTEWATCMRGFKGPDYVLGFLLYGSKQVGD